MTDAKFNEKMAIESYTKEMDSLTIHGVPKIFTTKSLWMKVMWFILCTTALSFLVYCTADAFANHFKHEVYLRQDRIPKHELKLPAISICNTNLYNILTDGSNGTYAIDQEFPRSCSHNASRYFKSEINREYFLEACSWFLPNVTGSVGEYKGQHIYFPNHFTFLPSIWPCVTLNRDGQMVQDRETSRAGLKMILHINETKHTSASAAGDIFDEEKCGMYVSIHDPKVGMPGFSGISLPSGYHTTITIRKKIIKRKPRPFPSNCFDPEKADAPNIFSGKYLKTNCVFSCMSLRVNEECGGILGILRPFMKPEQFPEVVNITDVSKCIYQLAIKTNSQTCNCQLPCEEEVYETKTSRVPWPQHWEAKAIVPLMNKAYFNFDNIKTAKQYLLKLSIFYEELTEFHYTEEEKYTLINVLSDFGGQMGLFIGASILSFVEIFLLITKCMKHFFNKHKVFTS